MKAARMASADEGQRLKEAFLVQSQTDDLFPELDSLVPSDLGVWQIIRESSRLLSQHFKCFLLPILFVTLASVAGLAVNVLSISTVFELVHASSNGRPLMLRNITLVPQGWIWALNIASLVLTSCAEVGFHRAVVAAYLKERYGTDEAPELDGIRAYIVGALRCAWSLCVSTTVFLLITCGVWGLVLPFASSSAWIVVLTLFLGSVLGYAFGVFSITILPASALTTTSGFQAIYRSFVLTRRDFKSCLGLYLTDFIFILVTMEPLFAVLTTQGQPTVFNPLMLLVVASVGMLILGIIYAPCRTVLYLKLRAWPAADGRKVFLDP
eukprot:TRINITY_DN273_c0_g1_i1.p1 TRINITY_DN273_c0_g1~~TRINITY_DN273_c0_g1_i1.p1  ORF type:complete len:324 (+),score=5.66 TRINITY_DN273_c0_g1_i1:133-1104(+)